MHRTAPLAPLALIAPLALNVTEVTASPTASREAAVAQAAHDVLAALYPGQLSVLDAALATTLSRLPAAAASEGSKVGAAAASATLDARANDGWNRMPGEYVLPDLPGYWKPTPPQNSTATFTHYPDVTPFVIGHRLQFLVAPPPALTSEHYAADFNEVKAIGTRAAMGRRRHVNEQRLWRQVTAIREADKDGNPATEADPTWLPLLATPPYPTYPGNMTCIAASQARTLDRILGRNDVAFTVTWTGTGGNPDITRPYNGFRELADEQERSRVYGGIHFTFDQLASFGVCTLLADYAVDNHLRARFPTP